VHDWSKCFGRPVSGVEGVFVLEGAGWGDTHATNLVVVCRARRVFILLKNRNSELFGFEIRHILILSIHVHRYHREEILSDINYLYLYGTTCNLITSGVGGGVGLCQCIIRFHNVWYRVIKKENFMQCRGRN